LQQKLALVTSSFVVFGHVRV